MCSPASIYACKQRKRCTLEGRQIDCSSTMQQAASGQCQLYMAKQLHALSSILQCLCTSEVMQIHASCKCNAQNSNSGVNVRQQLEIPTFMSQSFLYEHAHQSERVAAELPLQYSRCACGEQLLINHTSAVLPLSDPYRDSKTLCIARKSSNPSLNCLPLPGLPSVSYSGPHSIALDLPGPWMPS